jgi:ubiquinone/menaquinone biosynthesis C-methylase UbiE
MSEPVDNSPQAGKAAYIPALRFHWLTPLYDPVLRWAFPEEQLKRCVVNMVRPDATNLMDLGCGTGTLALMLHNARPQMQIAALDIDPAVLATAHRKADALGATRITFTQGSAVQVPFDDSSFDCVVSSLVLHHLTTTNKAAALRECFRVLRPGGQLLLADFAAPRTRYAHVVSALVNHMEEVGDNMRGLLPGLLTDAGFSSVPAVAHFGSVLGTLSVFSARRLEQTG